MHFFWRPCYIAAMVPQHLSDSIFAGGRKDWNSDCFLQFFKRDEKLVEADSSLKNQKALV